MVLSLHALPESKSSVPSTVMGVHTGYNFSSREPDILLVFVGTRHTCGALTCIQANTHKIKKKERERVLLPWSLLTLRILSHFSLINLHWRCFKTNNFPEFSQLHKSILMRVI